MRRSFNHLFLIRASQCRNSSLTSTDPNHILNIIEEDLSITGMTGIECALCSSNYRCRRNCGNYNIYLKLRQQIHIQRNTTIVLRLSLLNTAAHHLCNRHTCYADLTHLRFQRLKLGLIANDRDLCILAAVRMLRLGCPSQPVQLFPQG